MATRPNQGDPSGWGVQLNDWLDVSINLDGTLKPTAVQSALAGSIVATGDITINADSDASGAGDVILKTRNVERARIASDGTITGIAPATITPTNSELVSSVFYISAISGTINIGLFVAPFACKLAAIALVTAEDHTPSDTNYHTFDVFKQPGNLLVASKNTKVTGGAGITQWADWNFDAVAFDPTNQLLAKGDFARVRITPTGAPANITGLTITLRYEPT